MPVTGWRLDRHDRETLLERIRPRWPDIIADHVTLDADVKRDSALPPNVSSQVVGEADDGVGLQALVVTIDGAIDRPDGGIFHITWSLDQQANREPADSNDLIACRNWRMIQPPITIRLMPAWLD